MAYLFFQNLSEKGAPLGYSHTIDYAKSELNIQAPAEPVAFWEQTWEVNVKDLPYQVKGWRESEDLRKINKDTLKKKCLPIFPV